MLRNDVAAAAFTHSTSFELPLNFPGRFMTRECAVTPEGQTPVHVSSCPLRGLT